MQESVVAEESGLTRAGRSHSITNDQIITQERKIHSFVEIWQVWYISLIFENKPFKRALRIVYHDFCWLFQSQNYWPIKGWASPLSGYPHFSCVLIPNGVETFPEDLPAPNG